MRRTGPINGRRPNIYHHPTAFRRSVGWVCYAAGDGDKMIPKVGPYRSIDHDPMISGDITSEQIRMLVQENEALRKAGARLARRAMYVVSEHDGLHRLALAIADWAKVMGDEYGRGERFSDADAS